MQILILDDLKYLPPGKATHFVSVPTFIYFTFCKCKRLHYSSSIICVAVIEAIMSVFVYIHELEYLLHNINHSVYKHMKTPPC